MDFTNLGIAPLAAITTVIVVSVALLAGKYSEPKIPVLGFCASVIVTTLFVQPWFYTSSTAMLYGIMTLILLTLLGFAVGAFLILAPLKLLGGSDR
ncbi:MAG: hypothetical protein JWO16_508 [Sphingomonas bacterium]|nr:hypothetical protein [Sphingomonas bacterium]